MNLTQIIIVISISAITVCLVVLTVWLVSFLDHLKKTIIKTNLILDNAKLITDDISAPISQVKDFFVGIREGINLVQNFFNRNDK